MSDDNVHFKFNSSKAPILADGDFMGIFHTNNKSSVRSSILDIIREGIEREEKVFIDAEILNNVSLDVELPFQVVNSINLETSVSTVGIGTDSLISIRDDCINQGYSGIRFLGWYSSFFQDLESYKFQKSLSVLLKELMNGSLSIAVLYPDINSITFEQISRHPRIYYDNKVHTNPLFVLPEKVGSEGSPIKAFMDNISAERESGFQKEETFPRGVPNMLESIIESMGVGVVVGDTYGNMVLYNKAARNLIGLPPSPLPYSERIRRFGNFLPDEKTPFPFADLPLSRAIRGEQFEGEIVFMKNESLETGRWMASSGRGVYDSNNNLVGGVVVFSDITDQFKTRKEKEELELTLLQAQKMESLGLLAGGIAHDFNNLLVGVLGNVSMLLDKNEVSPDDYTKLTQVQQSALQLTDLTKQLLVYAGLSPCKSTNVFRIQEVLQGMKGILDTAVSKNINLSWNIPENAIYIDADEVQIRQILLNLIVNASDAHRGKPGTIKVLLYEEDRNAEDFKKMLFSATEHTGRYLVLEVSDTGGGISDDVIDKIFDPFFSTKGMGRGLGLSSVLGIIKNHKGALYLHSEMGLGSTFKIYFPTVEGNYLDDTDDDLSNDSLKIEGEILVIDDEQMVLDVAEAILKESGYTVTTAQSGKDGLSTYFEDPSRYALVIIDMTMPDMNGDEVYKIIREKHENVPVILSSGFSKDSSKKCLDNDTMCDFLSKPYRAENLINIVNKVCGQ